MVYGFPAIIIFTLALIHLAQSLLAEIEKIPIIKGIDWEKYMRIEKSKRPLGFLLCICAYAISGRLLFAIKNGDGCASNWDRWWVCF